MVIVCVLIATDTKSEAFTTTHTPLNQMTQAPTKAKSTISRIERLGDLHSNLAIACKKV